MGALSDGSAGGGHVDLPEAATQPVSGGPREIKRGEIFQGMLPDAAGMNNRVRPVLVIQNDVGNEYSPTVIVALITTMIASRPYPVNVRIPEGLLPEESEIRLHQLMTLDKTRLGAKMAIVGPETMSRVDEALRISLGMSG